MYLYWIAVRNYVSPEPGIVAFGIEQSVVPTPTYGYDWMGKLLNEMGLQPEQIKIEKFPGY